MKFDLRLASAADLSTLMSLVAAYHEFEGIVLGALERGRAIATLLEGGDLGRIWLILVDGEVVGYIAVCFRYSIEFAGRDAFVDEFFIEESVRGQGSGAKVLESIAAEAASLGIRALHLEVAKSNKRAQRLYEAAGFEPRSKYQINDPLSNLTVSGAVIRQYVVTPVARYSLE